MVNRVILRMKDTAIDDDDEEEEFEALFLRHKFQNHAFPWKFLSEAGWKYFNDARYEAPTGQSFETAKDVVEFLDLQALPDIFGNLQSVAKSQSEATSEQKKLRYDLIKLMYQQISTKRQSSRESDDENDAPSLSRMSASITSETKSDIRRSTRNRGSNSDLGSSAAADQGTELYLNKASLKQPKKPSRYQPPASDEPISIPSLEKCQQMSRDHSETELQTIQHELEENFDDWRFLLTTNHNLLFFGAGSKRNLLQSFGEKSLSKEGYVLIIDGFDRDVSVEAILDLFVELFLDDEPEPCDAVPQDDGGAPVAGISNPWRAHPLVERAITISRAIAYHAMETLEPIFLVVHNIEAEGFRSDVSQEALSALFVNSRVSNGTAAIRLVASIDDVDCTYKLWHLAIITNFSWIWKEVHTYRPYDAELNMLTHDCSKQKIKPKSVKRDAIIETSKARILNMLNSVAPKHAEVLQVLAQLQLEQMQRDEQNYWVEYHSFRDHCRKKYVIAKDSQLVPLLTELNDHDLVQTRKEGSFVEDISIPHGITMLRKIVAYDLKNHGK